MKRMLLVIGKDYLCLAHSIRSMIVLDMGKLVSFLLGPCNADHSPSVTIH